MTIKRRSALLLERNALTNSETPLYGRMSPKLPIRPGWAARSGALLNQSR